MIYVYLLESKISPDQRYVGLTTDLKRRFADHTAVYHDLAVYAYARVECRALLRVDDNAPAQVSC